MTQTRDYLGENNLFKNYMNFVIEYSLDFCTEFYLAYCSSTSKQSNCLAIYTWSRMDSKLW